MPGTEHPFRRRMRDSLAETEHLVPVSLPWLFVYLMGPYHGHEQERKRMLEFLATIRDRLRASDLQAFLATDIDDDSDYATQSVEFAKHSNAVVFVFPARGKNLGPGIELGAILEHLSTGQSTKRVLVLHHRSIDTSMLEAAATRWDATVEAFPYEDGDPDAPMTDQEKADSLAKRIELFVRNVMEEEQYGDLSTPPDSE